MRYLIFTNTPAHVHLYKFAVKELQRHGHDVLVLARDYGCTTDLLDWYDLPYAVYGFCGTNKSSLFRNLPGHFRGIISQTRTFEPDMVFGMGTYAAVAGTLARVPTVLILDSEPTSLDHSIATPLANAVLTPASFQKDLGVNHYEFDGFKECAYIHPDLDTEQTGVRAQLGLDAGESFSIIRFNAFGSHHDVGNGGFSPTQRRELIRTLNQHTTVFVSDEGENLDLQELPARPFDLHPARLHDALAEADLLLADTQTMVTEAALLGTPAIRSNAFVGEDDMGNFIELEREGLIYNHREFETVLETATTLLNRDGVKEHWEQQAKSYLRDKANLTEVIVDVATGFDRLPRLESVETRSQAHS